MSAVSDDDETARSRMPEAYASPSNVRPVATYTLHVPSKIKHPER